jgi:hypothetical protein
MGGMEPNPYEAPAKSVQTLPRKVTVAARAFRVGVLLAALGVVVFASSCAIAILSIWLGERGKMPFWFHLAMYIAFSLVPIGITIAVIGQGFLLWGSRHRPPNP